MNEVIKFLSENPGILSNFRIRWSGKSKTNHVLLWRNGKPYFCTSNQKPMFKELEANPKFELTAANPEFAWLRIAGEVEFTDDWSVYYFW